ncbi:MAG TPA: translocation/assembly module TamB domain-containing protein, partial [Anaeromyxobacteraceae bacterium]|nr:translocation/assembly module TamB domain-containing protein [Anaeromyxobacteraceae bacterium]
DITLSDEDLRLVESRFGRRITTRDTSVSRFTEALDLDLRAQIQRDVWLRSNAGLAFAIEFTGDVRAVKAPFAEGTNLYGNVEVVRGSVETLGRRFEISRGALTFNGPAEETLVDLAATLGIRTDPEVGTSAVEITLAVTGRLGQDLTVTLSSNPALDNADIVSLIATGRLAEDFIGGGALASAGEGLLLGQLAGLVEGVAGNTLGLDVVQISQEPGGLVIKLGKYLTNRAFVTVGYPIGGGEGRRDAGAQLTLEYTLLRWLLAQIEYEADVNGTGSNVGVGAIYEYTY